jgi:hypothetical protein
MSILGKKRQFVGAKKITMVLDIFWEGWVTQTPKKLA